MASEFVGSLEEDHLVAAPAGHGGTLHAGRAAADDHDLLGDFRRHGPELALTPFGLASGDRIHHAEDVPLLEVAEDALVGADTDVRLVLAALLRLANHGRVGDVGAGHAHHVRPSVLHDVGCHVDVADPADDEHLGAVTNHLLGASAEGDHEAVLHRHRGHDQMQVVVVAARYVEEVVEAGLGQDVENLLALGAGDTTLTGEFVE